MYHFLLDYVSLSRAQKSSVENRVRTISALKDVAIARKDLQIGLLLRVENMNTVLMLLFRFPMIYVNIK